MAKTTKTKDEGSDVVEETVVETSPAGVEATVALTKVAADFGREDLNELARTLNNVIDHLNEKER